MRRMSDALFEAPSDPPRPEWSPQRRPPSPPSREPVFNAPWPVLALVGAIVAAYAWQATQPMEVVAPELAFSPGGLVEGHWWTLVTALFLHGTWGHALMNAAFALAFATPVSRLFGTGPRGAVSFFLFYLVCGALASLGFAAVHWGSPQLLVGASGAVSGLMGAASRIIAGGGRLGRIFSRPVFAMGGAWVIVNILFALVGGALIPGSGGAAIAWEAHLAGFLAGVLLAGSFARLAGRP
jgi:membrane associated rhomboid family serine protease